MLRETSIKSKKMNIALLFVVFALVIVSIFSATSIVRADSGANEPEDMVDWFDVAAQSIGVDVDTLFEGMDGGQSIAEVAQANNIDPQTVVASIVTAEKAWLAQQVADGNLAQDEADEWATALTDEAEAFVNEKGDDFFITDSSMNDALSSGEELPIDMIMLH